MESLLSAYVHDMHIRHKFKGIIPRDINKLILLFYMHQLPSYQYIAIFCVAPNTDAVGHISVFNINDDKARHDIFIDDKDMFKEAYGTKITTLELNKFPESIRQNLFPRYKYLDLNENATRLHIMLRTEGRNETEPMTAHLIETGEKSILPLTLSPIDRCAILQSDKYGLITLGGFKKDSYTTTTPVHVLKWNENENKFAWDTNIVCRMKCGHGNHSAFMMEKEEQIFVCGGYDCGATELFSFKRNRWQSLQEMLTNHECGAVCYDYSKTNNMFVVGGGHSDCRNCDRYDFHKNKWFRLPKTKYSHTIFPDLKINKNGLLICTGNHYMFGQWGYSEFLDLRDPTAWKYMNMQSSLYEILSQDSNDDFFLNKTMRRICSL